MARRESRWHLADVVDFEVLLREGPGGAESRPAVGAALEEAGALDAGGQRRAGLRAWLEARRSRSRPRSGEQVQSALRLAGLVLAVVAFLAGIGVMRGMLGRVEPIGRAYNVWVFLGVGLGLQWLVLIGGGFGYLFVRRASGSLSLLQRGTLWLVRRFAGLRDGTIWKELLEGAAGYRSVLSWRVARLTQGAAVAFNLGLMAGFFGCLWVLKVGFYWESTLAVSGMGLLEFLQGMAWPWRWTGTAPAPSADQIEFALLPKFFFERAGSAVMWPFLLMSLAVYGLLPRLLLWMLCADGERRALGRIDFQAPRHRELWRQLTRVELSLPTPGPADGVVVLNVGGMEVAPDPLRTFLLRRLRVNPEAHYAAAVLDQEREEEAFDAIRESDLGVVVLVEGWALSPKEMGALHERVRAVGGGAMPIHFLVLGALSEGQPGPPTGEEWAQWRNFVDSLGDPATDAVEYQSLPDATPQNLRHD